MLKIKFLCILICCYDGEDSCVSQLALFHVKFFFSCFPVKQSTSSEYEFNENKNGIRECDLFLENLS